VIGDFSRAAEPAPAALSCGPPSTQKRVDAPEGKNGRPVKVKGKPLSHIVIEDREDRG